MIQNFRRMAAFDSCHRRLKGRFPTYCYLLERSGHGRQARALEPFLKQAKTTLPLDPAVKPIVAALAQVHERNAKWKLMINETVEVAE
ncbi:MAG: hypothetical protein IH604_17865 [Burkholderiales bacterium]|nr:hypothetical protein [Burkholderiales bacterium]